MITSSPPPPTQVWFGEASLAGAAAIHAARYPIRGGWINEDNGEAVEFELLEPTSKDAGLGGTTSEQKVILCVTASERRAEEIAREALSVLVDLMAFTSNRRVDVKLGTLTTARPGEPVHDSHRTIISLEQVRCDNAIGINFDWLCTFLPKLPDLDGERERRIIRAMRWFRRSLRASDEVEEFAALAFALEAVAAMLPAAPVEKKGKQSSGTSDKLRNFAVKVAKAPESEWKRVGHLRHTLFHGGITEEPGTMEELSFAIPTLRFVVNVAVKHCFGLSAVDEPKLDMPTRPFGRLVLVAPGIVTTKV